MSVAGFVADLFRDFPQPPAELDLLDPAPHHFLTYYGHIAFGVVALLAAAIALYSLKGGRWHRISGKLYLAAMAVTAFTALLTISVGFPPPVIVNAIIALYAGGGAYLAVQRRTARVNMAERALFGLGLVTLIGFSVVAANNVASGLIPPAAPIGLALPLFLLVAFDLNFLLRSDDYRQRHRIRRHLSRITWVLFLSLRNPVNEFRDVIGVNQQTVAFGPYLLVIVMLLVFARKARKLDRA